MKTRIQELEATLAQEPLEKQMLKKWVKKRLSYAILSDHIYRLSLTL